MLSSTCISCHPATTYEQVPYPVLLYRVRVRTADGFVTHTIAATLCTPPVDSLSDDPPAWALESLVASPECEPGLEVPIDCEEDDLPHLPGWVRKSMVKYVSPTGLWMDTPTRSVATEWEVRQRLALANQHFTTLTHYGSCRSVVGGGRVL